MVEGTYLDLSRGQRFCVSAFHPDTDASSHEECVIAVRFCVVSSNVFATKSRGFS